MAKGINKEFSIYAWKHMVVIPRERLAAYENDMIHEDTSEIFEWINQDHIPGEWNWGSGRVTFVDGKPRWSMGEDGPWCYVFGFSEPDAAFEFKIRWG